MTNTTHLTPADVAHLKAGEYCTARFSGKDWEATITGRLWGGDSVLLLGGSVIRDSSGGLGSNLAEIIEPAPPVVTVGERRWSPSDVAVVYFPEVPSEGDTGRPWLVYSPGDYLEVGDRLADRDVADWEIVVDGRAPQRTPEEVVSAVTERLDEIDGEWSPRDVARDLAASGLLAGSVPADRIPEGHIPVDLRCFTSAELTEWTNGDSHTRVVREFALAELRRRRRAS